MSHFLKDVDLSGDTLHVALVLDAVLFENLDSDFLASDGVSAYPHFAKCARAK